MSESIESIFDDELFDNAEAFDSIDTETGKTLSALVRDLSNLEKEIIKYEDYVRQLKKQKQILSTETIPALMDEMGLERVDVDGAQVKLRNIVTASIPMERKQEAFDWLREHGLDDIIKNDVILSFGKGEDNLAGDLMYRLEQEGFHPEAKTHIHAQTLKAFVRERVENNKPIDLELFGAYLARTAEVKGN